MKNIIQVFIVFCFGVMAGYGWQYHHHGLLVNNLKQEIKENQQIIGGMTERAVSLRHEIKTEMVVQKIIICESQGKHNAIGDGGRSYGPAQFQKKTFNWMKARAGEEWLQYKNPEHQIRLLKWALRNGHGNSWTCYRNMQMEDASYD